jgi:hypothetical protein
MRKFYRNSLENYGGIFIFQHILKLCQRSFYTCEYEHAFLPGKICSSSTAAAGIWRYAVPRHPHQNLSLQDVLNVQVCEKSYVANLEGKSGYGKTVHPNCVLA